MRKQLIHYLENHLQSCPIKSNIGIDCPGCGMQRSVIDLLKGNFIESFHFYPAIYTLILMYVFLILHLFFKFKKGAWILLVLFILNITIIVVSYVLKMYHLFT